jgi:putative FmdB family regulatory protein
MPVYTYHCENCGIQFDITQKFTEDPLTQCPECKKKTLRKVYSPVGIVFKGSGFYATDHRSPSGMNYAAKNEEKSAEEKKDTTKTAESPTTPAATAKPSTEKAN